MAHAPSTTASGATAEESSVRATITTLDLPVELKCALYGAETRAALVQSEFTVPTSVRVFIGDSKQRGDRVKALLNTVRSVFGPPRVASCAELAYHANTPWITTFTASQLPMVTGRTIVVLFVDNWDRLQATLDHLIEHMKSRPTRTAGLRVHIVLCHDMETSPTLKAHCNDERINLHFATPETPIDTAFDTFIPRWTPIDETITIGVQVKRIVEAHDGTKTTIVVPNPELVTATCEQLGTSVESKNFDIPSCTRARGSVKIDVQSCAVLDGRSTCHTALYVWDPEHFPNCTIVPVVIWGNNEFASAVTDSEIAMAAKSDTSFESIASMELAFAIAQLASSRCSKFPTASVGLQRDAARTLGWFEKRFPKLLENISYSVMRKEVDPAHGAERRRW